MSNCGKRIKATNVFCPYCGAKQMISSKPLHKYKHNRYSFSNKSKLWMVVIIIVAIVAIGGHVYKNSPVSVNMTQELYNDTWSIESDNPRSFSANGDSGVGILTNTSFNKNYATYGGSRRGAHALVATGRNKITDKVGDESPKGAGPGAKYNFKLIKVRGRKLTFKLTSGDNEGTPINTNGSYNDTHIILIKNK